MFEVTGMPENVDRAREEIEAHIAMRTGTSGGIETPGVDNNDFQFNGTDVSFEGFAAPVKMEDAAWIHTGAPSQNGGGLLPVSISGTQRINSNINSSVRMSSPYRNDSSSSLGSGSSSTESFYGSGNGNRMADFSPTCQFNANSNNNNNSNGGSTTFWFGENLLPGGPEELVSLGGGGPSSGFDPITISTAQASHPAAQPHIWNPFVDHQPFPTFDALQSQVGEIKLEHTVYEHPTFNNNFTCEFLPFYYLL